MVKLPSGARVLIWTLLVIYCEAKSLETKTTFSENESDTTPYPEELASPRSENVLGVTLEGGQESHNEDDTTTLCPEELEKKKHSENINQAVQNKNTVLADKFLEIYTNKDSKPDDSQENGESTTTICPDELENQTIETLNGDANESPKPIKTDSQNGAESQPDETTICPEELKKKKLELYTPKNTENIEIFNTKPNNEILKFDKVDNSFEVHQESEDRFENKQEKGELEESMNKKQLEKESSEEGTTICPEELLKKQENKIRLQNIIQSNTLDSQSESEDNSEATTVVVPQRHEENRFQSQEETYNNDPTLNKEILLENTDATTICPEEVKRQADKNSAISVKTLLSVQKDSALLKLVKRKFSPASGDVSLVQEDPDIHNVRHQNQVDDTHVRNKRQATNYSPYYVNQPGYNSQGIAVSPGEGSGQLNQNYYRNGLQSTGSASYQNNPQPISYNSRASNKQKYAQRVPVSSSNIRTYQQIQRQNQNLYPKSYQNYDKTVNSYQNPTSYLRYPSNGNFKNYYKLKSEGNRRQYREQAKSRVSSTTVRATTREAIKKKFRPFPVFS